MKLRNCDNAHKYYLDECCIERACRALFNGEYNKKDNKLKKINYEELRVYRKRPITLLRSLGYAMNDLNGSAWGTLVGSYLMIFLSTWAGLNAGVVGTMLFALKILDMIVCGVIGGVSDQLFRTAIGRRLGRRHILFLIGATLTLICFPLLFTVHVGSWLCVHGFSILFAGISSLVD